MAEKRLLPLPWGLQVATRGERVLLKRAFHREVQDKHGTSMNIKIRRSHPKSKGVSFRLGFASRGGSECSGECCRWPWNPLELTGDVPRGASHGLC